MRRRQSTSAVLDDFLLMALLLFVAIGAVPITLLVREALGL